MKTTMPLRLKITGPRVGAPVVLSLLVRRVLAWLCNFSDQALVPVTIPAYEFQHKNEHRTVAFLRSGLYRTRGR
ncbi:hypothetical protein BJX65DRAFT_311411 [Aspergillus insuetus]